MTAAVCHVARFACASHGLYGRHCGRSGVKWLAAIRGLQVAAPTMTNKSEVSKVLEAYERVLKAKKGRVSEK